MYVVTYGDVEGSYKLLDVNSGERPLIADGKLTFEAAVLATGNFEAMLVGIREAVNNCACPKFFIYLPGIEDVEERKFEFNLDFLNRLDMIVRKGHWFAEV